MSQRFQYVTVDTILSKYLRDFKGLDLNEDDAIEWIGEALGFMKLASASEEAIAFLEVKNYQAPLPNGLHYIIQVARNNAWSSTPPVSCTPKAIIEDITPEEVTVLECGGCNASGIVALDCQGNIIGDTEVAYYRPYFDLQYEYMGWAHSRASKGFTPVRLANHAFFNTLVCKTDDTQGIYRGNSGGSDEYSVVDTQLRFSFKEGFIALAYLRQRVDAETGYPMVPDDESAKAAITYYLGWKMKEREAWNHREGASQLAQLAEAHWLKYIKQFKNKAKMPFGTDEYEDLRQQSTYLLPRQSSYFGFFGNLGQGEQRNFNDPSSRNRYRYIGNLGYR